MNTGWIEKWNPIQLLAPNACLHCQQPLSGPLCKPCLSQLETIAGKGCRQCSNPLVHCDAMICQWCSRLSVLPQKVCTLFAYREVGRTVFHKIKYEGYWPLVEPLLQEGLHGFFRTMPFLEYACIMPIPESFSRKIKRHFNPADILAVALSEKTGLPVSRELKMNVFQRHQVGLGYEERRKNTKKRFRVSGPNMPETVILVDDVLTTGATLEAATRACLRAGARKVAWLTLFRRL